jgi:hypothetical protein
MHEISGVPGAELFQQIGPVEIDGPRTDTEVACDFRAGGAASDLSQRDAFFGSQSSDPSRASPKTILSAAKAARYSRRVRSDDDYPSVRKEYAKES